MSIVVEKIVKEVEALSPKELSEFLSWLVEHEPKELSDTELLAAARKAGTFALLDDPSEDIY